MNPYMQTVLESECAAVRNSPSDGHNEQLNKSAINVCAYVKGGSIDEPMAKAALLDAWQALGKSATEYEATWKSAYRSANARVAPEPVGKGWRGRINAMRRKAEPVIIAQRQTRPAQTEAQRRIYERIARKSYDLLRSDAGAPGRAYLEGRGLRPELWDAFNVGYCTDGPVPGTGGNVLASAIVLPWYRGAKVCGLRYRFLQTQLFGDGEYKATSERGSRFSVEGSPILFGTQALDWDEDRSPQTVVLVEGEINAISIRQATGWHVFSYGSESSVRLHPRQTAFFGQYARCVVWADKPEIALKLKTQFPDAVAIQSPKTADVPKGLDANDLLRMGVLGAFLERL